MNSGLTRLLCFLLGCTFVSPALSQTHPFPTTSSGLGFGASVAIHGETIYASSAPVGWPRGDEPANSVYLYSKDADGNWMEKMQIQPSDGITGDNFGRSIYVDDSLLIVGAPGLGVAYVFEPNDANIWQEAGKLEPSSLIQDAQFAGANNYAGYRSKAIARAGDRIAVTSYSTRSSTGAVHIFAKNDGVWTEETILQPTDKNAPTDFGWSLAASGDFIFAGAWRSENEKGVVHAFKRDVETNKWEEISFLIPSQVSDRSAFGYALASSGNTLYVGSPGANRRGRIFIYTYSAILDAWGLSGSLTSSNQQGSSPGFGGSLSASPSGLIEGGRRGGNAHLFQFDPSLQAWTSQHLLMPSDTRTGMGFGFGVAIGENIAVVGSPRADFEEGVASVYEPVDGSWTTTAVLASEVPLMTSMTGEKVECAEGVADLFDCQKVDLLSFLSIEDLSTERGVKMTDLWGWTDPVTDVEYVLQARTEGLSFVDIRDPYNPVYVGEILKTEGSPGSAWRDVKVYKDHAFIVADGAGAHGMQVFDLTQLRDVAPENMPVTFEPTVVYDKLNSSHNIVINEETGFAYSIGNRAGGETCGGQLHMINIQDPKNPTFAGCFFYRTPGGASSGLAHDAQCVIYRGPDDKYQGKEVCFKSSGNAFTIVDVTDKTDPMLIARTTYPNLAYTHQGWLTEDQKYFYMNDELDELNGFVDQTRTLIWDLEELEDPVLTNEFMLSTKASDHNLYVQGNFLYQSNYQAGLRILDITDPENPVEVGHFDTTPNAGDEAGFGGSWSNYPYFKSGVIAVSSRGEGLFLVRKQDVDI